MVMCTHLHVDHVGWNTQRENGRWVPTFKNAKYVWSQDDFDFYPKLDNDPEKGRPMAARSAIRCCRWSRPA